MRCSDCAFSRAPRSARSPAGRTKISLLAARVLDDVARLSGAIVIAFAGMTLAKSQRGRLGAKIVRWIVAVAMLLGALWIVVKTIPHPRDPGMPTFSIVGSAVLIAGLAVEELIGADVRRLLGL